MFERFTDEARRVVVMAQEQSRLQNHNYIGTEHVLLGLLSEQRPGLAFDALTSMGIALDSVRRRVSQLVGRGKRPPSGHIPFTPRAKKILELSLREALRCRSSHIGPEHLLLALLGEREGLAAQILVEQGVDLDAARASVLDLIAASPDPESATAADPEIGILMLRRENARLRALLIQHGIDPDNPDPGGENAG